MTSQPILAFDCACVGASIALLSGGATHTCQLEQSAQAAQLVSTIDNLLREHNVHYRDLACMVTTVGPGSFTGVRIGLSVLHGLALVNPATPLKLLTTLEAVAWQVVQNPTAPEHFYVALRAGKGEVYAQAFTCENQRPQSEGSIFLAAEGKDDWDAPCFGNALAPDYATYIAAPDAAVMAMVAEHVSSSGVAAALPCYIRPPDAKLPSQVQGAHQN